MGTVALLLGLTLGNTPAVSDTAFIDQYGETDRVSAYRGKTVVVMVVSARRLREIRAWEEALRERFEGLTYLRVADVDETRRPGRDDVAAKLAKRVPEGVAILIDIDRRWVQELQLDTSHTNVLVFDEEGAVRAHVQGKHRREREDEIGAAIDALRQTP